MNDTEVHTTASRKRAAMEETSAIAREIIQGELEERIAKTERLRAQRLARESATST
jgi:hypothetical protein